MMATVGRYFLLQRRKVVMLPGIINMNGITGRRLDWEREKLMDIICIL
jgi:hypothetical protein